uniref:NR LBD domain-containing protein n=1 Tax=Parascaris univalens TaxID=6257 RepID=A0A915A6R5_PARUN
MPDEIRQQTPMGDFLFGLPLIGQAIIGYRKLLSLRRTARSLQPGHQIQKLFEEKSIAHRRENEAQFDSVQMPKNISSSFF